VYCRFCTRSYAVGVDTEEVEKVSLKANEERWEKAFAYIESRPELEDIVISGGDAYQLRAGAARATSAMTLLEDAQRSPHALRHQGPGGHAAEDPHRHEWTDALTRVVEGAQAPQGGRAPHALQPPERDHRHHRDAMNTLFERGITVRNQTVLQRGVNDSPETMTLLVKRLGHVNVHPYYVYVHDLVKGVEDLRTTVDTAIHIEKHVRGSTAGFNTPVFVVDAPGGGGKRDVPLVRALRPRRRASASTRRPSVKPGQFFIYFDPLHQLSTSAQRRWADPAEQEVMVQSALQKAKERQR
jgi:lysine 2,3-aminomutase